MTAASTRKRSRKPRRAAELGVTDEEYDRLLAAQDGVCAICGNPPKTRRLHVDHDHKTGAVRGLLCWPCNRMLAKYVTIPRLWNALAYLQAHERIAEREATNGDRPR